MKKIILIFMTMLSMPSMAQWTTSKEEGDELKGTKSKIYLMYWDNNNLFQFDNADERLFILKTSKSFFNFSTSKGASGRFTTNGIVGLYDDENNLIEKIEMIFEVYEPPTICYPNKYTRLGGNNYKRSKKIIDHIKNGNGYVRFILPLHYSTEDFDFKVPAIKNKLLILNF